MWRGFETKALYDNHMKNQVKQGAEESKSNRPLIVLPPCLLPEALKKDNEQLNQLKKYL